VVSSGDLASELFSSRLGDEDVGETCECHRRLVAVFVIESIDLIDVNWLDFRVRVGNDVSRRRRLIVRRVFEE